MKNKSNAVYTKKWLSKNKNHWHLEVISGASIIVITKLDAPRTVIHRVNEINIKRRDKAPYYRDFINVLKNYGSLLKANE